MATIRNIRISTTARRWSSGFLQAMNRDDNKILEILVVQRVIRQVIRDRCLLLDHVSFDSATSNEAYAGGHLTYCTLFRQNNIVSENSNTCTNPSTN